jgi:dUTPase
MLGELAKATPLSTGYDVRAMYDMKMKKNSIYIIDTGVYTACDSIIDMQARSRSGIARQGVILLNSLGTIDADYRGSWKWMLMPLAKGFDISFRDRIGQMVLPEDTELKHVDFSSILTYAKFKCLPTKVLGIANMLYCGENPKEFIDKAQDYYSEWTRLWSDVWNGYTKDVLNIDSERGVGGFGSSGMK